MGSDAWTRVASLFLHDDVIKWNHIPRYWPFVREFPAQMPVTRSFDVFFDLCPNKRLSKQWWGWWFEPQSYLYDVIVMIPTSVSYRCLFPELHNNTLKMHWIECIHSSSWQFIHYCILHDMKEQNNICIQSKRLCLTRSLWGLWVTSQSATQCIMEPNNCYAGMCWVISSLCWKSNLFTTMQGPVV